jgi:YVTN family beta-propeller protein
VIDVKKLELKTLVGVGQRPWNMAINQEGNKLYVAAGRSHAVSIVDLKTHQLIKNLEVGRLPWGAAAP